MLLLFEMIRIVGARHDNVDAVGRPASIAGHIGQPGEVRVAFLVGEPGGATRFEQSNLFERNFQVNGEL